MIYVLAFIAVIIILCTFLGKVSGKLGIPMLVVFIILGMLLGEDGPIPALRIPFEDFDIAEKVSTVCLIFIMFYGGFGTNWQHAKKQAVKAGLLSSVGVILTAEMVGLFCHFVLKLALLEGLLIGAVIASTDAATVFFILRSKKLNLKMGTAPMLELESGSNDPWSYMLTIIVLQIMQMQNTAAEISPAALFTELVLRQLIFGFGCGALIALLSVRIFKKISAAGVTSILMVAIALLSYALPSMIGGNGYLSVYIVGIVLGNTRIDTEEKVASVHFFDGVTNLLQIALFFLLGLLSTPREIPLVIGTSILIMLFLTLVARPIAVGLILTPFKAPFKQQLIVNIAGFRGAASIAFAIIISLAGVTTNNDVFHIVFCIVLLSIIVQGMLLPYLSKELGMVDDREDVMKTFSDYQSETDLQFVSAEVTAEHPWANKLIKKVVFPPDVRAVMILRGDEKVIPKGDTQILPGDVLILVGNEYLDERSVGLTELRIDGGHYACGKRLSDIRFLNNALVVLIKRTTKSGVKTLVPNGNIILSDNDVLVMAMAEKVKTA
ncbi:MAG: potassium/proton antiporter [Ruminococcus sp.]|jgi:cell volume regulation protein A|nr:potassium/proton antiporter [Ruminococcus sp.]